MLKSVKTKLFLTICIVIVIIILFFVVINSTIIEKSYYYEKQNDSLNAYNYINENLNEDIDNNLEDIIDKMCLQNNYDIVIEKDGDVVYSSRENFLENFEEFTEVKSIVKYSIFNQSDILYSNGNVNIRIMQDKKHGMSFMMLYAKIDSGNNIYVRTSISSISEATQVSNKFLNIVAVITIIFGGVVILIVTERFTKPIQKLDKIARNITKLDFSEKYELLGTDDEVDNLGKSINELSKELEDTIKQMKKNNMDLERDIEHKSKIDEMRKQFISDVSHELKTPISLIQGYAEGLIENVNTDEESKNFYSEVILDEANKMDKLVKRLLELMKLEYEDKSFNDKNFDIVELINEIIRISKVKLEEEKIEVEFDEKEPTYVFADDFYIERVITNYFTNAIKNVLEVNGKKQIKINLKKSDEQGKVRISVFNTGNHIDEEHIERIWNRFYKIDESRDRSKGGTGIGLSLVKAIMIKYNNNFGVNNVKGGVEFYFELNYSVISGEM
ncbi:MAG: GHKL domain-containing protein [Clostridia bacterium]|nr:GHKL domain-containing protein [Clostridia bacterium]